MDRIDLEVMLRTFKNSYIQVKPGCVLEGVGCVVWFSTAFLSVFVFSNINFKKTFKHDI